MSGTVFKTWKINCYFNSYKRQGVCSFLCVCQNNLFVKE